MIELDWKKYELLEHFVENDWNIWVDDEEAHLIVAEMPFLDIKPQEEKGMHSTHMLAIKVRKPTTEEKSLYYFVKWRSREEEVDRYYNLIKKLNVDFFEFKQEPNWEAE